MVIKVESQVEIRIRAYLHSCMNKVVIKNIMVGNKVMIRQFWDVLISKRLISALKKVQNSWKSIFQNKNRVQKNCAHFGCRKDTIYKPS